MSTAEIAILMANKETLQAQLNGLSLALQRLVSHPDDLGLLLYVRDTAQSLSGVGDRLGHKADGYLREASGKIDSGGAIIDVLRHGEPTGWPDVDMMQQAWDEEDEAKAAASAEPSTSHDSPFTPSEGAQGQ